MCPLAKYKTRLRAKKSWRFKYAQDEMRIEYCFEHDGYHVVSMYTPKEKIKVYG